MEHWLEQEIAEWVHPMKDQSDDPLHHERMLLLWSYISLPENVPVFFVFVSVILETNKNSTQDKILFVLLIHQQYYRRKKEEMFYLLMHSTHFIYGYMAQNLRLRTT